MRFVAVLFLLLKIGVARGTPPPLTFKTFRSGAVNLRSGQIANTRSQDYPLEFPEGPIAVRHFTSRVVDEQGNNVSMAELYVHHWLIYDGGHNGGMCANLPNIWGIGAELNRVIYTYPYPSAYVTTGKEQWSANLHFIRTSNVPAFKVQDCIECRCADSDPPLHVHGEVNCCRDQSMCWGMENSTLMDGKNYYLEYTIGFAPVTEDTIPLTIISLDVTATTTTDCQIQYDVPGLAPGENHTMTSDSVVPTDWNISNAGIHLHVGGLVMTLEHFRGGKKMGDVCTGLPTYIDEEGADGQGHLIDIPYCVFETPYQLKKGDVLRLTSIYGARTLPEGNPWHAGVMGLAFLAVSAAPDPEATCLASLHYLCGTPIYTSGSKCRSCALIYALALAEAGCRKELISAECDKNHDDGNIPPPDSISDMTLRVTSRSAGYYTQTLTCPVGVWCAVAVNTATTDMLNASAFVYSAASFSDPEMVFHARTLGFHNAGTDLGPHPAVITQKDGVVTIVFDLPSPFDEFVSLENIYDDKKELVFFERACFLFAQGTNTTTFGYHGSSRGFSCLVLQQ